MFTILVKINQVLDKAGTILMKFHTFFEQHLTVHVGRTCIVSKTPDAHKVEKGGGGVSDYMLWST